VISGAAGVGLILFFTLIVSRLIQSRQRGLSVRMQIFLALGSIVGALSVGLGILVIDRVNSRADRLAIAAATDETHALAGILESEMARTGISFSVLAQQLHQRSSVVLALAPLDGDKSSLGFELLTLDHALLFPPGQQSRAQENDTIFVDTDLTYEGKPVGIVRVVKFTLEVRAMLADFAPAVLVVGLLLMAAAAGAAAWIGRTIAAPIESLSEYSRRVSSGEKAKIPTHVVGREVGHLVDSINTMRLQLEGRPFVETFTADLSHELKNPVAAVRASAEVLLDGALDEPQQAHRFVTRIHQAAERIEKLLAELLSLAQIEARGPEHLEKLSVGPLVDEVIETLSPSEKERVHFSQQSNFTIKGDRGWITRALSNLIHNALIHSPALSPIHLELSSQKDDLILLTKNQGALDEHVRLALFERFVTTRRALGGTGLGLSIVAAVAEAHGGRAELVRSADNEVVFSFRLPLT